MTLTLIIIISIALYVVAIGAMWYNLNGLDKKRKAVLIIAQMALIYIITLIVFLLGQSKLNFPSIEAQALTRRLLVTIFAGVNAIIIAPLTSKQIGKAYDGELEKEELIKNLIIILVVFAVCLFFESGYMKNIQEGIIEIYKSNK